MDRNCSILPLTQSTTSQKLCKSDTAIMFLLQEDNPKKSSIWYGEFKVSIIIEIGSSFWMILSPLC